MGGGGRGGRCRPGRGNAHARVSAAAPRGAQGAAPARPPPARLRPSASGRAASAAAGASLSSPAFLCRRRRSGGTAPRPAGGPRKQGKKEEPASPGSAEPRRILPTPVHVHAAPEPPARLLTARGLRPPRPPGAAVTPRPSRGPCGFASKFNARTCPQPGPPAQPGRSA